MVVIGTQRGIVWFRRGKGGREIAKLVPIAKDDDEVGEYLRFIDRRYHCLHSEIEHLPENSSSNKSEVGCVGWTWD